jgi:hypothetical protein
MTKLGGISRQGFHRLSESILKRAGDDSWVDMAAKDLSPSAAQSLRNKHQLVKQMQEVGVAYCQGGEWAPLTWDPEGTQPIESGPGGDYLSTSSLASRWMEALPLIQCGERCDDEDWADMEAAIGRGGKPPKMIS